MPGRYEAFEVVRSEIARLKIKRVICLAPHEEIAKKSPEYAKAIDACQLDWVHEEFPVTDYGAPTDLQALSSLAERVSVGIRKGESVLVHCGAGIGRTGTIAICVLIALGTSPVNARNAVRAAGSAPERSLQDAAIASVARIFGR